MSKTALQEFKHSLDYAYFESAAVKTAEQILAEVRINLTIIQGKERAQIIKAFEAGAKLQGSCTPEAYYNLVYGQGDV